MRYRWSECYNSDVQAQLNEIAIRIKEIVASHDRRTIAEKQAKACFHMAEILAHARLGDRLVKNHKRLEAAKAAAKLAEEEFVSEFPYFTKPSNY